MTKTQKFAAGITAGVVLAAAGVYLLVQNLDGDYDPRHRLGKTPEPAKPAMKVGRRLGFKRG